MRRRTPLNLILVVIVVVLAIVLWFGREQTKPKPPITQLKPDAIHNITLQFLHAPAIKLAKTNGQWRLTAPVQARAETSAVERITAIATDKSMRTYNVKDVKLSNLGLAKPRQTIMLNGVKIALGKTDAIKGKRYARIGNKVYMINAPGKMAIDADYSNLVARKLLPEGVKISQIELPRYTLTRNDKAGWNVQPANAKKSADALQNTVDTWRHAHGMWIKPANKKHKTKKTVKIHLVNGKTYLYQIIARKPQLLLRRPDLNVVYHIAGNHAAPMLDVVLPKGYKHTKAAHGKPEPGHKQTSKAAQAGKQPTHAAKPAPAGDH